MQAPLRDYQAYCTERRHRRPSTLHARMKELTVFLDVLRSRNVSSLAAIQPDDLSSFVTLRPRLKPRTLSRIVSNVRSFLHFLTLRGTLQRDFSSVLPTIRVPLGASIPSVWDPVLLNKLLAAVDRSSPRGKRDQATLLLAYRLGLRVGDIRTLTLGNVDWSAEVIEITQSETENPLQLPLTADVGAALIGYLYTGRPQTTCREVFVKLTTPFAPFAKNTHLGYIVKYRKELAGIKLPARQRQGPRSLRHTKGMHLLQAGISLEMIRDFLGHVDVKTTQNLRARTSR